jgi:hypothetical protein
MSSAVVQRWRRVRSILSGLGAILVVTVSIRAQGAASEGAGGGGAAMTIRPTGNQYISGVEGLKGGSLPPPGFYWRMYNAYYRADDLKDAAGDNVPIDFDIDVYAMANRLLWVSDIKLLGGNYFASAIIPFVNTDVAITIPGSPVVIADDRFGLGDVDIDFFNLVWRGRQWEAGFGLSFFAPTGKYSPQEPASPGKGMWSGMATLAGTYYMDTDKTWAASVLGRYEIHGEQDDRNVTYGDDLHFEWGVSKTLARILDIGLCGYCQWQTTDDHGSDVTWDRDVHDRGVAVGPEVSAFIPPAGAIVSLRTQWELAVRDRTEGHMSCLTITKFF